MIRKLAVTVLCAAGLALGASPAQAQDTTNNTQETFTGSIQITGGFLQLVHQSGSLSFASVNLNQSGSGGAGTTDGNVYVARTALGNAAPVFRLVDTRGTGAGWNVTLQASTLNNGVGNFTIPGANIKYNPENGVSNLTSTDGSQAIDPTNGPKEVGGGAVSLGTATKVVSANTNFGQGEYTWSPVADDFSLDVPSSAAAGNYSGTLTATIVTGP